MIFFVALGVAIVVVGVILWRRGTGGLGSNGASPTEAGVLGEKPHQQQNSFNPGGGA